MLLKLLHLGSSKYIYMLTLPAIQLNILFYVKNVTRKSTTINIEFVPTEPVSFLAFFEIVQISLAIPCT